MVHLCRTHLNPIGEGEGEGEWFELVQQTINVRFLRLQRQVVPAREANTVVFKESNLVGFFQMLQQSGLPE